MEADRLLLTNCFGFFNLCTLSLEGNQKTAKVGAVLPSGGSPPSSWIFENSILTPPLHSTKKRTTPFKDGSLCVTLQVPSSFQNLFR